MMVAQAGWRMLAAPIAAAHDGVKTVLAVGTRYVEAREAGEGFGVEIMLEHEQAGSRYWMVRRESRTSWESVAG